MLQRVQGHEEHLSGQRLAPKYRNTISDTWCGLGRMPKWLVGKSRADHLVNRLPADQRLPSPGARHHQHVRRRSASNCRCTFQAMLLHRIRRPPMPPPYGCGMLTCLSLY
ncbi:H-NS family nucleoid-associated regulatory protein [Massilia sp. BJB1822]|uniref:H-NS family nucleoid-associated regulatory protein n=1 Tax=Massilia sp. BJB1822 TaxID=2744470 RepID=UPI001592EB69|nr:H-NS histone family protein [Massilia sp. BJB1822]